jgi:hypothetical protein
MPSFDIGEEGDAEPKLEPKLLEPRIDPPLEDGVASEVNDVVQGCFFSFAPAMHPLVSPRPSLLSKACVLGRAKMPSREGPHIK